MFSRTIDVQAESEYPLMPFAEVADPEFFGDEMVRKSHPEEIDKIEEGRFLFLLDEPVEKVTVDPRVVQLVGAVQPRTIFHKIILEEYFFNGKTVKEVASVIAKKTPEVVSLDDVEMMIRWSIDEMPSA